MAMGIESGSRRRCVIDGNMFRQYALLMAIQAGQDALIFHGIIIVSAIGYFPMRQSKCHFIMGLMKRHMPVFPGEIFLFLRAMCSFRRKIISGKLYPARRLFDAA